MANNIEGMKDKDLDVLAVVKAFEAFRDEIQLVSDKADMCVVDLDFESSFGTNHYKFKQEDVISLSGVVIEPTNKKLGFKVVFGANDKTFYYDEAELIVVTTTNSDGNVSKRSMDTHIKEEFIKSFSELKIGSIVAFQALLKNNPPLTDILNDPSKFLEEFEKQGARGKAYSKILNFGKY